MFVDSGAEFLKLGAGDILTDALSEPTGEEHVDSDTPRLEALFSRSRDMLAVRGNRERHFKENSFSTSDTMDCTLATNCSRCIVLLRVSR